MLEETNKTVTLADLANAMELAVYEYRGTESDCAKADIYKDLAAAKMRNAKKAFNDAVAALKTKRKKAT